MINPRRESGMAAVAAVIILALIGLCILLGSCRSTRTLTDIRHDTLIVATHDTLTVTHWLQALDSVGEAVTREVTLTPMGDTIRLIEWRDRWRDRWRTRHDTVDNKAHDTIRVYQSVKAEKVTDPPWRERLRSKLGWFLAALMAAALALEAGRKR